MATITPGFSHLQIDFAVSKLFFKSYSFYKIKEKVFLF